MSQPFSIKIFEAAGRDPCLIKKNPFFPLHQTQHKQQNKIISTQFHNESRNGGTKQQYTKHTCIRKT